MMRLPSLALAGLRWTVGGVLGVQAAVTCFAAARGPVHAYPRAALLTVAAIELVGCVLLLLASRRALGPALVLVSLALAAALHVAHGEAPPASFLVYAASLAVLAARPVRVTTAVEEGGRHG